MKSRVSVLARVVNGMLVAFLHVRVAFVLGKIIMAFPKSIFVLCTAT